MVTPPSGPASSCSMPATDSMTRPSARISKSEHPVEALNRGRRTGSGRTHAADRGDRQGQSRAGPPRPTIHVSEGPMATAVPQARCGRRFGVTRPAARTRAGSACRIRPGELSRERCGARNVAPGRLDRPLSTK
jgi:hypothetical protein